MKKITMTMVALAAGVVAADADPGPYADTNAVLYITAIAVGVTLLVLLGWRLRAASRAKRQSGETEKTNARVP